MMAMIGAGAIVVYYLIKNDGVPTRPDWLIDYGFPERIRIPILPALLKVDPGALKVIWVTTQVED